MIHPSYLDGGDLSFQKVCLVYGGEMVGLVQYIRVVFPFAYCYFLLFFLRNLNAVLATSIDQELKFSAFSIGLMSGMFLFFTSVAHWPMSKLVDRWNAKLTQVWLLMCAMLGVGIYGASHHMFGLMVGRALMGIGMTGGLLCSMRALNYWFGHEKVLGLIGVMTVSGAVGAMAGTYPLQQLVEVVPWRGVMMIIGGMVLFGLLYILIVTPKDPMGKKGSAIHFKDLFGYREYFHHPQLLKVLIPGAFCFGGFVSLQSLWLGEWFEKAFGYTSFKSGIYLLIIAFSMMLGMLSIPLFRKLAKRWGISLVRFQMIFYLIYLLFLFLVSIEPFGDHIYGWIVVAYAVQVVFLNYRIVLDHVKGKEMSKAMSFSYIVVFGVAFLLQVLFGAIVSIWERDAEGFYPVIAYQAGYWTLIALSCGSLWWARREV